MKDLGKIKVCRRITVNYDVCKHIMTLDQSKYVDSLARKYNVENSKLYNTPM